jgi:hypothetical protein
MSQGFQIARLQAALRNFYGHYSDLIYPYNLYFDQMLHDIKTKVCSIYPSVFSKPEVENE